jgi:hypothetical protein
MAHFPAGFHDLAITSLAIAFICAVAIVIDELRRPQKMWIMNIVWPLTALFGSVLWLAAYLAWGRTPTGPRRDEDTKPPFAAMVLKGASHCGAGCTLGDILAEWACFVFPAISVWFGWHALFDEKIFAIWIPDFITAFLLGIAFQYFTIKPMRDLSIGKGVVQALKADVASISAWQVGMYGTMALLQFAWFRPTYGGTAEVDAPEFWFAMQIAMLGGFATSYPVNWWLIRAGAKEAM